MLLWLTNSSRSPLTKLLLTETVAPARLLSGSATVSALVTVAGAGPSVYEAGEDSMPASTGASLTAVTVTARVAGELVPPSPSARTKRTVRAAVDGLSETLRYVTARTSAWAAAGVALELNVT